jgi:hypothetical protein
MFTEIADPILQKPSELIKLTFMYQNNENVKLFSENFSIF